MYRKGGGKNTHTRVTNVTHRNIKLSIAYIIQLRQKTEREKGTVGGKSSSEVRITPSERVPRKDVGKSGTEHL